MGPQQSNVAKQADAFRPSHCRRLAGALVLLLFRLAAAAPIPDNEHVDIALSNVRWQALPAGVEDVYPGPDGRAWYRLFASKPPVDLTALKQMVEREFGRPAPQLRGVEPVLFEPDGRVWFIARASLWTEENRNWYGRLFGYDGKNWTVRNQDGIEPAFPGHTDGPSGCENLSVDGQAFFIGDNELTCFDGKSWSVKKFVPQRTRYYRREKGLLLQPEPDGKGVVALQFAGWPVPPGAEGGGGGPPPPAHPELWRWHGGAWIQASAPDDLPELLQFLPVEGGIWMLYGEQMPQLRFHPYDTASPRLVRMLAAKLTDADGVVREHAMVTLESLGQWIAPHVKDLLKNADDPELDSRLKTVLRDLGRAERLEHRDVSYPDERLLPDFVSKLASSVPKERKRAADSLWRLGEKSVPLLKQELASGRASRDGEIADRVREVLSDIQEMTWDDVVTPRSVFGPYRLQHPSVLERLPGGRICVSAQGIQDGAVNLGPGLAVLSTDWSASKAVADRELFEAWDWRISSQLGPRFAGNRVWLPRDFHNDMPCLVDTDTWKIVARMPDPRYDKLLTALPDGRLFAAIRWATPPSTVMAFVPDAPDGNPVLKAEQQQPGCWLAGVASDGSVWAVDKDRGVLRFDGSHWNQLDVLAGALEKVTRNDEYRKPGPVWAIPGHDGQMLVKAGATYGLCSGGHEKPLLGYDLQKMLRDNRERFITAFSARPGDDPDTDRWRRLTGLVVDKDHNVWLLAEGSYGESELSVLVGGKWARTEPFRIRPVHLAPLDGGAKVYVTNFEWGFSGASVGNEGVAVLGRVDAGKVVLDKAPSTAHADQMHPPVRDATGGLWVPYGTRDPVPVFGDAQIGAFPQRLTDTGASDPVEGEGWPVLADASGNLWFARASVPAVRYEESTAEQHAEPTGRIDQLAVRRDGKIACRLPLSGGSPTTFFFSDAPGSVYAFTETGLHHFASTENEPGRFALDKTYHIDGIRGGIVHVAFSRLGYVVITSKPNPWTDPDRLYLVPLPRHGPR